MAVLLGKPRIQPLYAPVLLELSQRAGAELRQRTAIQLQQLFPQLRVMLSQLPQLVDTLERAAPAGRTVVNLIQSAEVKATVVTGLERLRLRDAPFHEGIPLILAAPRFIGGDTDIVDRAQLAFVPQNSPGLTVVDDWACLGQRTTASGTVLADNLPVNPFHLFPTWKSYASPTLAGPFAQLTTAAIDAGIARAALDDTVAFVRNSARPWIDAGVARASDDPLTIYHIGQLDSRLAAADALLERAGRVLDRYKNDLSEEHVAEASLAVARAKIWTTEVALEAASRLFELGGTRATGESLNLDRHWRNARVHTLHDPVRWKYQLLGNWVLNGIRPQRHDWN